MSRTTRSGALAACLAAVLTLAGCADTGAQGGAGSQLSIATLSYPQSLDPAQAVGS
ncbi:ABC transporter substrate-binding protein, partial [Streptomyces sp. SID7982]|nr:ABC transporter substrate-binding protein [Streptomyces sp. SID7982]